MIACSCCGGEGRKYASRYGGNDPDVWDAGECEACKGSGGEPCSERGCSEPAVAFDEDGNPLCEDCLSAIVAEASWKAGREP